MPSLNDKGRASIDDTPEPGDKESKIRNHLANERTFLSWIRTGVSLIGLGFVVARLGLFLREIAGENKPGITNSLILGVILILLGAAMNIYATRSYFKIYKQIEENRFEPPSFALVGFALSMVVLAILAIIILFTI